MKNGKKEGIIADTEIFLFYIFIFHVMHYIQYYLQYIQYYIQYYLQHISIRFQYTNFYHKSYAKYL